MTVARAIRPGLRANLAQFALLVLVNALTGAMVGMERSVLPVLAEHTFGVTARAGLLSFVLAFGLSKAFTNLAAGAWADRCGRRPVLLAGWLTALPVPLLLAWAPSWGWVLAANVLLGISQGLAWSTAVVMKIDLAGPSRRGLAMGLNEAAGYAAVAGSAALTGWIAARHGMRPVPFLLGEVWAVLGTVLTLAFVRETRHHAALEPTPASDTRTPAARATGFWDVSVRDRDLSAITQAGLVNNLNDGVAWGLFPTLFAATGLGVAATGALAAVYPAVWGLAQLGTGALSDRVGRKAPIVAGMFAQGAAIALIAGGATLPTLVTGQVLLGLGTAMVYPTLLAAIADVVPPASRAPAVGAYRLWRDLGYAAGAVIAGALADAVGIRAAVGVVAALTAGSGAVVLVRMRETLRAPTAHAVAPACTAQEGGAKASATG